MGEAENRETVRRYFEGPGDGRDNTEIWDELCDPNLTVRAPVLPEPVQGLEMVKGFTRALHGAFTGLGFTVDDMVGEGDRVVACWTMRGRNTGPIAFPGAPPLEPTGRDIQVTGISVIDLANGKITGEYTEADWLGMLTQLGAIPAPSPAA